MTAGLNSASPSRNMLRLLQQATDLICFTTTKEGSKMKRRIFCTNAVMGLTGLGLSTALSSRLFGSSLSLFDNTLKDIQAFAGGIPGGVLPKEMIESRTPVRLAIYEGGHFHTFDVKEQHYDLLIEGKVVNLTSNEASGHTHMVTLDPNRQPTFTPKAVKGYDPSLPTKLSEAVTVEQQLAAESVTVSYNDGTLDFNVTLSTQDLCGLRAGIRIDARTDEANGITKLLRFDPKKAF